MAMMSFTTWFSSPSTDVRSDSIPSLSIEEHATTADLTVTDENEPQSPHLRFTFTPTQVKQRPRAWERKAATPFAPRNESQKIWKRVPLQHVAANINAAWREGEKGDGIMRPVKKLRVAALDGDITETACSTISRWDLETSPAKTPRRRKSRTFADFNVLDAQFLEDLQSTGDCLSPSLEQSDDDVSKSSDNGSEEESVNSSASSVGGTQQSDIASHHFPSQGSPLALGNDLQAVRDGSGSHLSETALFREDMNSTSDGKASGLLAFDADADNDQEHLSEIGRDLQAEATCTLAQHTDEDPTDSCTDCDTGDCEHLEPEATCTEAAQTEEPFQPSPAFTQVDNDDASYLQAFLSRSRAQREAKSQPSLIFSPQSTNVSLVPAGLQLPSNSPDQATTSFDVPLFESASLPTARMNTEDDQKTRENTNAQASSPCRRSSRIIRIPRPQKPSTLPNTISLRRLNGTEFIAMKESQSLAIATRTNTKRNKGPAMNVRQRLIQLHAEKYPPLEVEKSKTGKGVVWSDMIAKMQGPGGSEVAYVPEPEIEEDDAAESGDHDIELESEPVSTQEQKAVRRRRKESLGNANGTPAPKKTAELILNAPGDASKSGEQVDVPRPTPMKRGRTKSRPQH